MSGLMQVRFSPAHDCLVGPIRTVALLASIYLGYVAAVLLARRGAYALRGRNSHPLRLPDALGGSRCDPRPNEASSDSLSHFLIEVALAAVGGLSRFVAATMRRHWTLGSFRDNGDTILRSSARANALWQ